MARRSSAFEKGELVLVRTALFAMLAAAGLAGAAHANDTIDAITGNVWVFHYPDGAVETYYTDDNRFTASNGVAGDWTLSGNQLCVTLDSGGEGCVELAEGKSVGDSWEMTDMSGLRVRVEIRPAE